jgi:hypothetical protein
VSFPLLYFGSISYYQAIFRTENPVFDVHERYVKQTQRNRCSILGANGVLSLTIPVSKPNGSKSLYSDIQISPLSDWKKQHWKAIESAYSSAAYFDFYGMEVHELIFQESSNLFDFNWKIHERICSWLSINPGIPLEIHTFSLGNEAQKAIFNDRKEMEHITYYQLFQPNSNFEYDLSILDAIMNIGPLARKVIF